MYFELLKTDVMGGDPVVGRGALAQVTPESMPSMSALLPSPRLDVAVEPGCEGICSPLILFALKLPDVEQTLWALRFEVAAESPSPVPSLPTMPSVAPVFPEPPIPELLRVWQKFIVLQFAECGQRQAAMGMPPGGLSASQWRPDAVGEESFAPASSQRDAVLLVHVQAVHVTRR